MKTNHQLNMNNLTANQERTMELEVHVNFAQMALAILFS